MSVTNLDFFTSYHIEADMCDTLSPLRFRGRSPSDPKCKLCHAPQGDPCHLIFRPTSLFERGHPVELDEPFSGPIYQSPEQLADAELMRDDPYLKSLREERERNAVRL